MFLNSIPLRLYILGCLLLVNSSVWAQDSSISAVIASKGLGCELTLPESILKFKPLKTNQLTGSIQTYQIKPLIFTLSCSNEKDTLFPVLTVDGNTPYPLDNNKTIFLSSTPNGVGFMLRFSNGESVSLADFYDPDKALKVGVSQPLASLNADNQYQFNTLIWVGLVGPFLSPVQSGYFNASVILNIAFQ